MNYIKLTHTHTRTHARMHTPHTFAEENIILFPSPAHLHE